ncbi:MAG: alpha-2-macroglobulin family protein [Chitinophagaceae bacterium]
MRIYLLSLLLFLSFNALAQPHMKFNSPYDAQWKKTDSLMNQSLPKSARDIVEKIYQDAQAKNIPVQMLKAQIYFMRLNTRDNEAADSLNIARAESEIQKTPFPLKAVWQSIAAELYWDYYQQNRYKILQRTTTTEAIGNDFEQWDAAKFAAKTSALYYQSLSNAESLKGIAIEAYNPVLVKGHNSENLRPTLFDLLAFRAVGFFENEEAGISKPAFAFVLDDEAAFAPATEFAQHKFKTQDSSSNEFNALLLYQEILRLHATDQNQDAFIDADLQRLSFVYAHSVHPNKKVLYQKSLAQIETRYNTNPLSAMASFTVLQLQMNDQNLEENDGEDDGEIQASNKVDLRPIVKKLEALVQKFPGSEGAINAQGLIAQIQSKSLTLKAEEAVLPNTPSKVLLSYKNLNKVWIRVLKTDAATYRETGNYRDDKYIKTLLAQSPIKAFSVNLPSSDDFRPHSTEVKLDALPLGMYAVLISGKENFQTEDNALSFAIFQATNLAIITQQTPANSKQPLGYILDRKTGSPVPNCQITLFKQEYNNKTYNYDYKPLSIGSSANDGSLKMNNSGESYSGLMLKKGDDVFYSTAYLNFYRYDRTKNNSERTFFFTDRSIYRPGQTIYFKGIVVASEEGGLKNNVVPNKTIEVTFYDANSQKIASQKLKTNEWGSVAGNFVAPAGVLTGMMRIEGNNGSVYVSVEEYKRPKFRVDWDTLKSDYALNEKVSVIGHALAYAGNNVDGAMVKYRVVRNVRWPSWWYYWRYGGIRSAAQEIAQGTTTTDANGNFTVPFQALPDRNIDERSLPVFTYSIHADVTDLNGETRSGDKSLSAGYRSLQIETSIPEMASRKELESIPVSTQNLNGDFVAASVSVKVARLQQPDVIFRKRLWNTPDQFVMSEAEFHAAFPLDAYKDENDYKTWKTASVVAEKTIVTSKNGNLNLPSNTFPNNGLYLLTFSTKDKNGKPVEEKKYVQVWDKENAGKPYAALLVRPDAQTLEPSQKAEVSILSGMDKVHLIRQVQTMDDKVESLQENLENAGSTSVWKKDITEADRGGIALSYITIKDNRVYTGSARVNVPWSNKELNIKWETHRDKLLPGAQEIWTMIVEGNKKDKVAAELVAALYDASLDAFKPHSWSLPSLFPSLNANLNWNSGIGFGLAPMRDWSNFSQLSYPSYWKEYDELIELTVRTYAMVSYNKPIIDPRSPGGRSIRTMAAPMMAKSSAALGSVSNDDKVAKSPTRSIHTSEEIEIQATPPPSKVTDIPIRKNLQETAFFYPQLQTDANGVVRIQFTIPEALTEWKLLAFAHTKDMRTGFTAGTVKTQKDLMVQPGLPRFLRQGDELSISTKIVNLSDKALSGTATLEIINPATNLPLNLAFRLKENKQNFSLEKGSSTSASWTVTMPESRYEPVIIRISAQAGNYTDGEENTLPVLTNRMLVTETMPLWINGNGTKNFTFDKLLQSNQSKTLAQHAVTVEYTANPAWYAVQALPYLMEYPYECAEQTFNRYYANALAAHILDKAPRVKEIFKRWESLDTAALQSNLEKNQELKSALLEETPWVLDAQNETQQKHNIALLFQNAKLARDLKRTAQKLEDMMLPEGGFAWFKGDTRPDRYITQYIVTGLGRLQHLGIKNTTMTSLAARAMPYLDRKMESDYRQLLKDKRDLKQQQIGNFEVQYMYMRSFFPELSADKISKEAVNFYKGQAQKFWPNFNPYTKGMIALALHRDGDMVTTKTIIKSLKETAIEKEELGMYWMEAGRSWWWWDAPIEAQSLLIECFSEVAQDNASVDKMKRWLLKQKQTQNWSTTKGTADACYALLLQGTQWLNSDPEVSIQLGSKTNSSKEIHAEAGTGYFKTRIPGADV